MAVSAKFQADFTSFYDAVQKAEVQLRGLDAGAGRVEKSLDRMSNSLAGTRLIQDATLMANAVERVGGTSKLTQAELQRIGTQAREAAEKMQRMGIGVPENLRKIVDAAKPVESSLGNLAAGAGKLAAAFGVGFGVSAVVGLGKALLNDADALVKMSDRTGITIQWLQKLQVAGDDAGNTVDEMVGAITQMQNRLTDGDQSAVGALNKLHLSLGQLRSLSPDQQFVAISDALRAMENPSEQVNVAMDLFGRQGASVLPVLKRGFDDLKNSVVGMSESTARSLDTAGDQIQKFWRSTKNVLAEVVVAIAKAPGEFGFAQAARRNQEAAENWKKHLEALGEETKKQAAAVYEYTKAVGFVGPVADAATIAEIYAQKLKQQAKEQAEAAEKTKKAKEAVEQWHRSVTDATIAANLSTFTLHRFGATTMPEVTASVKDAIDEVRALPDALEATTFEIENLDRWMIRAWPSGTKKIAEARDEANHFAIDVHGLAGAFGTLAQVSGDSFDGVVQDIGRTIAAFDLAIQAVDQYRHATNNLQRATAIAGGVAAVGAATGSGSTGSRIASGALAGAAAGSVFPGVGTAIGAGVGAFVGWLRGRSASAKAEDEIRRVRQEFIAAAGGMAELERSAAVAGVTLDAVLNAKKPEAYQAAILNLNNALAFQDEAMQTLEETAKKYGFALEELGPKFGAQQLDKKAQELFRDFQVLSGAGIDLGLTVTRMSEATNDYVHEALKMGLEIPSAMRPMLQKMAEMGLLTDDAGNVITDLEQSGIKFAETMTQGFDRVVKEVQRLVDAIERGLSGAIASVPALHVPVSMDPIQAPDSNPDNPFGATGGWVTSRGIQAFGMGGRVLPFHARGSDTVPAMLTPGELVLNANQQSGVRALLRGGGGRGASTVNNVSVYVDGEINSPAARRKLASVVEDVLDERYRLRRKVGAR